MAMPYWSMGLPWNLISKVAYEYDLSPKVVAAIVQTESGGNAKATRYENGYRWIQPLERRQQVARNLGITLSTETLHQQISWGLMQVMGATARELGFRDHLVALTQKATGLHCGCQYLQKLIKRHKTIERAIVAYNAGSVRKKENGDYVNQSYLEKIQKLIGEIDNG